jgi:SAM-dependent MidA family methyltransferase
MGQALYGPEGFFTASGFGGPSGHFRTSATVSPLFSDALARLFLLVDQALGQPARVDLVDVGAGRGELLSGILSALPGDVAGRTRPLAVEMAGRPTGLPAPIGWSHEVPEGITGLLVATEWLDNVPLDVAMLAPYPPGQWRYVLVDRNGVERTGPPIDPADAEWLADWWPAARPGNRAELGAPRDQAWAAAVSGIASGLALTVDYGHLSAARPPLGTLTGFRDGREVRAVPDGSCDVTAHVALDAVAAAGERVAGRPSALADQRSALRALGVDSRRPPLSLASADPREYLRLLSVATQAQELTAREGLGGHYWLAQPVGLDIRPPWTVLES